MWITASRGLACIFGGERRVLLYDLEEDEEGKDDEIIWPACGIMSCSPPVSHSALRSLIYQSSTNFQDFLFVIDM